VFESNECLREGDGGAGVVHGARYPSRQLVHCFGAPVPLIDQKDGRVIGTVTYGAPDGLIHAAHAHVLVIRGPSLSSVSRLLGDVFDFFDENRVVWIGIRHAHNNHAPAKAIAEIDAFGHLASDHRAKNRTSLGGGGAVDAIFVLFESVGYQ